MFELNSLWDSVCVVFLSTFEYDIFYPYIFISMFSSPGGGPSGIESTLPLSHPTPGTWIVDHMRRAVKLAIHLTSLQATSMVHWNSSIARCVSRLAFSIVSENHTKPTVGGGCTQLVMAVVDGRGVNGGDCFKGPRGHSRE